MYTAGLTHGWSITAVTLCYNGWSNGGRMYTNTAVQMILLNVFYCKYPLFKSTKICQKKTENVTACIKGQSTNNAEWSLSALSFFKSIQYIYIIDLLLLMHLTHSSPTQLLSFMLPQCGHVQTALDCISGTFSLVLLYLLRQDNSLLRYHSH